MTNETKQYVFSDLKNGQSFDFINDSNIHNVSFFKRCIKTGGSTYIDTDNVSHRIGNRHCYVYHVDAKHEDKYFYTMS